MVLYICLCLLPAVAIVIIASTVYTVPESSPTVRVCALITTPRDGLECNVEATLALVDGDNAGTCT